MENIIAKNLFLIGSVGITGGGAPHFFAGKMFMVY